MIIYERDNGHPASTGSTQQRVYLINLADHLCPALHPQENKAQEISFSCPFLFLKKNETK